MSPALLLVGLNGLTGNHGCCEMWWQWALQSVFLIYLRQTTLYSILFIYDEKNGPHIVIFIYGRIETSANFASRCSLDGRRDGWVLWRECDGGWRQISIMTTLCIATGGGGMETKKYSDNASYFGGMYLLIFHMKIPVKCSAMWLDFYTV